MNKKLVYLGIAFIMLFSLAGLTACGKEDLKLDEELKSRIEQDYLKQFGHEFYYSEFYGTYGESSVFFVLGADLMIKDITISGVRFYGTSGWTILVWNSGNFYDLEEIDKIFESGILTQSNLKKIGRIHAKTNKS